MQNVLSLGDFLLLKKQVYEVSLVGQPNNDWGKLAASKSSRWKNNLWYSKAQSFVYWKSFEEWIDCWRSKHYPFAIEFMDPFQLVYSGVIVYKYIKGWVYLAHSMLSILSQKNPLAVRTTTTLSPLCFNLLGNLWFIELASHNKSYSGDIFSPIQYRLHCLVQNQGDLL